jgi:integrase
VASSTKQSGRSATPLLSAGVHPKVAQEALGHSSVAFTMDTYQHVMPSMQETATRAIQDALGRVIAPAAE